MQNIVEKCFIKAILCEWKTAAIPKAEISPDYMPVEIPPKMSTSSFMRCLKGRCYRNNFVS